MGNKITASTSEVRETETAGLKQEFREKFTVREQLVWIESKWMQTLLNARGGRRQTQE